MFIKKKVLVVWEDIFPELGMVARELMRGMRWFRRLSSVAYSSTYGTGLDSHLEQLLPPRKVLLVAHGENGAFLTSMNPAANLPESWWGRHDSRVDIYAFGCGSALCFDNYDLGTRVKAYLGYGDDVNFYIGTKRSRRMFRRILGSIGLKFVNARSIDERLKIEIEGIYTSAMLDVARSYSSKDGDRLSLIFLEEQLQGLRLMGRNNE